MKKIETLLSAAIIAILILTSCTNKNTNHVKGDDSSLVGKWYVEALVYNNHLIDINDDEQLKDMYNTNSITINDDNSFVFQKKIFGSKGTVEYIDASDTKKILLNTKETFMLRLENGEMVQKPTTSDEAPLKYIAVILDGNTMEVNEYDPVLKKAVAGKDPYYFVKEGEQSTFIAEHKYVISSTKSSSSISSKAESHSET